MADMELLPLEEREKLIGLDPIGVYERVIDRLVEALQKLPDSDSICGGLHDSVEARRTIISIIDGLDLIIRAFDEDADSDDCPTVH